MTLQQAMEAMREVAFGFGCSVTEKYELPNGDIFTVKYTKNSK